MAWRLSSPAAKGDNGLGVQVLTWISKAMSAEDMGMRTLATCFLGILKADLVQAYFSGRSTEVQEATPHFLMSKVRNICEFHLGLFP